MMVKSLLFSFLLLIGVPAVTAERLCGGSEVPFPRGSEEAVDCMSAEKAYAMCMHFLEENLPSFDEVNKGSLGFLTASDGHLEANEGVANVGTNLSLTVRSEYSWAAQVPMPIFLDSVLPFSNVNEAVSNWRPLMFEATISLVMAASESEGKSLDQYTIAELVYIVNEGLWSTAFNKSISFKSNQTPLIYDPMSVLAYSYASCTGVSIFLIDALRSIGIPARIAGTPAWNKVEENGNHNWVEVWVGLETRPGEGGWQFIEAKPAGAGETLSNPCDKWFCNPSQFANGTQVFAALFRQRNENGERTVYPMAWDLSNEAIPGEDRTAYYQYACNQC